MKKSLTLACVLSSFLLATAHQASAQVKIGMVDMNNIFSSYYKTKDAESRINEARASAKKELDTRMETYKVNLEKINKLNEEINKPELSEEAKAAKSKTRDETIAETKNLEREITEFRGTREKQLQDQAVRMRNNIVEEITKLVEERVKTDKYDVVFDKSGQSLNGVPIVLFSSRSMDFSDSIIEALNKTRGKSEKQQ
jgi:Skp family chaperone for outer membrane proteins